jgi:uncharacterized membrane protein YdjX (TVP38/TMEM64 family)
LFKVILAVCFGVVVCLSFYAYQMGMWHDAIRFLRYFFTPKRLEAFIASYGSFAGVVFVSLQALQVVVAPIPGEITGFVGGFLFGRVLGVLISTLGLTLGSLIAFSIARIFGVPLVEKIVKKKYRDKFSEFVAHRGLYLVFILFLIPGFPKDSLCYLLGLTPMGYIPFILINVFGRLPGTVILTWQGAAVQHQQYLAFFLLVAGSLLLTIVLYVTRKSLVQSMVSFFHGLLYHRERRARNTSIRAIAAPKRALKRAARVRPPSRLDIDTT